MPRRINAASRLLVGKSSAIWSAGRGRSRVHIDNALRRSYCPANQRRLVQLIPSAQGSETPDFWRKVAALWLVVAALGLPVNDLFRYALLVAGCVLILTGVVAARPRAWLAGFCVVIVAMMMKIMLAAPRIDEGHNVFVIDGNGGALKQGLPADVFAFMRAQFDAQFPPERRCDPKNAGCWRGQGFPDRAHAFSADGIFERPLFSRRVSDVDFDDATWQRLGFVNEAKYNWYGAASDLQRVTALRGAEAFRNPWQAVFHQWHLSMPWFVVYRFPADFAGSQLCWRGNVLWEGPGSEFTLAQHAAMECRTLEAADAGRRIFGVAILQDAPLAMKLAPTASIHLRQWVEPMATLIGVCAVLCILVRVRARRTIMPFALIGAALVVVLLNDASFVGGWRPYDGGDDGLFYEGTGRKIAQDVLAGDWRGALRGGESVFFYGGPGLRYLRALERFIFGDSNLGYLSLMLALPVLVYAVFRRFLPQAWAIGMIFIFVAVPIGALFGSTYFLYIKWAARGFADPAAAFFLLAGLSLLVGKTQHGPDAHFAPALATGLMFFLALFVRPNLAPIAGVLLGGAGLAALWQAQYRRLAGLCVGFLPVLSMALHNWYFGNVFVPFSANATIAEALPMPPSAYIAALSELLRLDFSGGNLARGLLQLARWLGGPSESHLMIPVHAAAIAITAWVAWRRGYDPWLRLSAWAALAGHPVAFFYLSYPRYYYVVWFLILVVCAVWLYAEGVDLLRRFFPGMTRWFAANPISANAARAIAWCSARQLEE
jgi:hypothetical protein